MIRRPPRSTLSSSSAASDVYKRQVQFTRERSRPRAGYVEQAGRLRRSQRNPRRDRSVTPRDKLTSYPHDGVFGPPAPTTLRNQLATSGVLEPKQTVLGLNQASAGREHHFDLEGIAQQHRVGGVADGESAEVVAAPDRAGGGLGQRGDGFFDRHANLRYGAAKRDIEGQRRAGECPAVGKARDAIGDGHRE